MTIPLQRSPGRQIGRTLTTRLRPELPQVQDNELVVDHTGQVNTWLELKFLAALEHGRDEGGPVLRPPP